MVPIPGGPGGVLVGIDPGRGTVGHYTKEGLLIGSMKTCRPFSDPAKEPWVVGRLDSYLAVNCSRDPRDGLVDVFVEDNMNQRIVWYRVDDTNIQTVGQGPLNVSRQQRNRERPDRHKRNRRRNYPAGTTVNLAAAAAAPTNKVFAAWTGNTTGVANVSSPNTTLVMPNSAVTLTATYDSRPGAHTLTVNNGTGSGSMILELGFGERKGAVARRAFAWTGDRQILANWLMPTTSALMPSKMLPSRRPMGTMEPAC